MKTLKDLNGIIELETTQSMRTYLSNQFPVRDPQAKQLYALFEAGVKITTDTTDYSRLVVLKIAKHNNGCKRLQILPV